MFAKPFLSALDGHRDGVFSMCRHPQKVGVILSGACDGEVRVWDVSLKTSLLSFIAHRGFVRGVCTDVEGKVFYTCGDDAVVKRWKMPNMGRILDLEDIGKEAKRVVHPEPLETFMGKTAFHAVDHHRHEERFATASEVIGVWDPARTEPLMSMEWGADSMLSVKWNPVENTIIGATGSDRAVVLYDTRSASPLKKIVMAMKCGRLSWNPQEAFNFTAACEDSNLYSFDMRKMKAAKCVHMDHVSAVLDVDYSPTGREFVSGSYDRTIRIFPVEAGHSREVYHTKRMQRVFSVLFSQDARFVFSGSDDTNVRVWKARAGEKLGIVSRRERAALHYSAALKKKFRHVPDVRRIDRHRHLPKEVYSQTQLRTTMKRARRRKQNRLRAHSAPGSVPFVAERKKHIVADVE